MDREPVHLALLQAHIRQRNRRRLALRYAERHVMLARRMRRCALAGRIDLVRAHHRDACVLPVAGLLALVADHNVVRHGARHIVHLDGDGGALEAAYETGAGPIRAPVVRPIAGHVRALGLAYGLQRVAKICWLKDGVRLLTP